MDEKIILEKLIQIVHECMPETVNETFTMDSVVNRDIGMDSMNFIFVICKIEAEFNIRIPDKKWMKLSTVGDIVNTVKALVDKK